jgi:translation elongation factor EF-G
MAGMGELHLDVACSRLLTEHRVKATLGRARLAYRETLWPHALPYAGLNGFTYDRTLGGGDDSRPAKRLFAGFDLVVTASAAGAGEGRFSMAAATVRLSAKACAALASAEYADALRQGLLDATANGPIHGFAMAGVHLEVPH